MSTTKPITNVKIENLKTIKANDSEVVHIAKEEEITGTKTFSADKITFENDVDISNDLSVTGEVSITGNLSGTTISATTFTGDLTGTATNATKDSSNNIITKTYLPIKGGTETGVIRSSFSSKLWINSVSNSCISIDGTEYNGWICGPTTDGRIAISSYPASNNNLYFGYATNDQITAGTNSFNSQMYWDAPNNHLHVGTVTATLSSDVTILNTLNVSSATTITLNHNRYFIIVSAAVTITIPKIAKSGFMCFIKNGTNGSTVTVKPSSCKLDASKSSVTLSPLECMIIVSDGTNWWRMDTSARFQ